MTKNTNGCYDCIHYHVCRHVVEQWDVINGMDTKDSSSPPFREVFAALSNVCARKNHRLSKGGLLDIKKDG